MLEKIEKDKNVFSFKESRWAPLGSRFVKLIWGTRRLKRMFDNFRYKISTTLKRLLKKSSFHVKQNSLLKISHTTLHRVYLLNGSTANLVLNKVWEKLKENNDTQEKETIFFQVTREIALQNTHARSTVISDSMSWKLAGITFINRLEVGRLKRCIGIPSVDFRMPFKYKKKISLFYTNKTLRKNKYF